MRPGKKIQLLFSFSLSVPKMQILQSVLRILMKEKTRRVFMNQKTHCGFIESFFLLVLRQ